MPVAKKQEKLETTEFIQGVQVVACWGVGLVLALFGLLPLLGIWYFLKGLQFDLRNVIAVTLLGTYVFAVVETFAIIILWGLGRLYLPKTFVPWLGRVTIGEIVVLLLVVVKSLFFSK